LIDKPKRVPWRFRALASALFKEIKIAPFEYNDQIEIPSVSDFQARVAEEFLKLYGPRRFISFTQRCQLSGPWAETITIRQKVGPIIKSVAHSKLEYELAALVKKKNQMAKLKRELSETDNNRLIYLETLMSDQLMQKSDKELIDLSGEIIRKLQTKS
jgi:hypothetical protein